jgi:aminoglycoside phosphotransferase (APT) family kinase protein
VGLTVEELLVAAGVAGTVTDVERMLGGASRETWSLRLDGRPLVLRRDPPGGRRAGAMAREATLLRLADAAGMPVPSVVAFGDDFLLMGRLDGETIARRILRDEHYAAARRTLTGQCAEALARLHTKVAVEDVPDLPVDTDPLRSWRDTLDALGEPHPALELGFARLAGTRPESPRRAVCHGDFRLGNLMVDESGLVGVLDWELAHAGDPAEDLGWMCVRSWRFGGPHPVAGVGERNALLDAYAAAGGDPIDEDTLRWWEAFGTLRWGVICIQQASTHLTGARASIEHAAIGRRICEVELDLLDLLDPQPAAPTPPEIPPASTAPHDRPTAVELLDAVRGWIEGLAPTGHDAFLARVTDRVLAMVQRELQLGPALASRHADRLAAVGVRDDAEFAAQIRAGRDDADTVAAVRASVLDKLVVADPRQLSR